MRDICGCIRGGYEGNLVLGAGLRQRAVMQLAMEEKPVVMAAGSEDGEWTLREGADGDESGGGWALTWATDMAQLARIGWGWGPYWKVGHR